MSKLGKLSKPYRVTNGGKFRLSGFDPADTGPFGAKGKDAADEVLGEATKRIGKLQQKLYAEDRWAVLLVFQGMDTAGKDGTINHVLGDVHPQGTVITSFKAPTSEEIEHDFLWRAAKALPERGHLAAYNRSYYEEMLIVRLHPEILAGEKLPERVVTRHIWKERCQDITAFERHLVRSGVLVCKFFLHISREEQRQRLLARLDDPEKSWKFQSGDVKERARWDDYQGAHQAAIRGTATRDAPWYVVPADAKWFARVIVASAVVEALASLDPAFPLPDAKRKRELTAMRKTLEAQGRE